MIRLYAEDGEDVGILSAHLQDALARVKDLTYIPSHRRFVSVFNRVCREEADMRRGLMRCVCALHIEDVLEVKARGIEQEKLEGLVQLLAMDFQETNRPSGEVRLIFAGSGEIRLVVEDVNIYMKDLDRGWVCGCAPDHD